MSPRESGFMCARCGAGLDLEDTSPLRTAVRLGVVARGLKTYIVDDDTSLSTALATAERDVRHAVAPASRSVTFANFCFGCRQYVCGRDWNEAVERCQICVPLPLPPEAPMTLDEELGAEIDGVHLEATNGDAPSPSPLQDEPHLQGRPFKTAAIVASDQESLRRVEQRLAPSSRVAADAVATDAIAADAIATVAGSTELAEEPQELVVADVGSDDTVAPEAPVVEVPARARRRGLRVRLAAAGALLRSAKREGQPLAAASLSAEAPTTDSLVSTGMEAQPVEVEAFAGSIESLADDAPGPGVPVMAEAASEPIAEAASEREAAPASETLAAAASPEPELDPHSAAGRWAALVAAADRAGRSFEQTSGAQSSPSAQSSPHTIEPGLRSQPHWFDSMENDLDRAGRNGNRPVDAALPGTAGAAPAPPPTRKGLLRTLSWLSHVVPRPQSSRDDRGRNGAKRRRDHKDELAVQGFTDDCLVRGRIVLGSGRLSDLVAASSNVALRDVHLIALDDGRRLDIDDLEVERDELVALEAVGPRGNPGRRRHTVSHPVAVRAGPYRMWGNMHALPGLYPIPFGSRRGHTVPLTDVRLRFEFEGRTVEQLLPVLILNLGLAEAIGTAELDEWDAAVEVAPAPVR